MTRTRAGWKRRHAQLWVKHQQLRRFSTIGIHEALTAEWNRGSTHDLSCADWLIQADHQLVGLLLPAGNLMLAACTSCSVNQQHLQPACVHCLCLSHWQLRCHPGLLLPLLLPHLPWLCACVLTFLGRRMTHTSSSPCRASFRSSGHVNSTCCPSSSWGSSVISGAAGSRERLLNRMSSAAGRRSAAGCAGICSSEPGLGLSVGRLSFRFFSLWCFFLCFLSLCCFLSLFVMATAAAAAAADLLDCED